MIDAIARWVIERWPVLGVRIISGYSFSIEDLHVGVSISDGKLVVAYHADNCALIAYAYDYLDLSDPGMFAHFERIVDCRLG